MKKLAIQIGTLGSALGALAGVIEMSIGNTILPWIGNKESPIILGAITLLLSATAFMSVLAASRNETLTRNRQLLIFLGVLLPATICFTTVGRLWYLPGLLLLATSFILAYESWFVQAKANSSEIALKKISANQIIGVTGSGVILISFLAAFFNSSFGLYQSEMLIDSEYFRFEILPMDIALLTHLSGSMKTAENIEVRIVMIIYLLLILGAAIALIASLVKSKLVTGIGGSLVFTALAMLLICLPYIMAEVGVPLMSLRSIVESLAIGWYLSVVGMSLIILSIFLKGSCTNIPNSERNP